jgi:hypothetical protein
VISCGEADRRSVLAHSFEEDPTAGCRSLSASVSDLEVHREDLVGRKSNLPPWVLGPAADRCLAYGVPQRVERSFCFSQQHVRSIAQLALLHQASRRLARRLRSALYCRWKHRAAVEVRPDAVGQVRMTPWAPV